MSIQHALKYDWLFRNIILFDLSSLVTVIRFPPTDVWWYRDKNDVTEDSWNTKRSNAFLPLLSHTCSELEMRNYKTVECNMCWINSCYLFALLVCCIRIDSASLLFIKVGNGQPNSNWPRWTAKAVDSWMKSRFVCGFGFNGRMAVGWINVGQHGIWRSENIKWENRVCTPCRVRCWSWIERERERIAMVNRIERL